MNSYDENQMYQVNNDYQNNGQYQNNMYQYDGQYQGDMGYQQEGAYDQNGMYQEEYAEEMTEQKASKTKEKKSKKKEKELEPQCYTSVTNMTTWNYNVYYMSQKEKIIYFLLAFVIGAAVGYIFFGGLFKDAYNEPTKMTYISNVVVMTLVGGVFGKIFLPMQTDKICNKKKAELKVQFRDMLEALTTSLNAGSNVNDAFQSVCEDLRVQYGDEAYIVYELNVILSGVQNNFALEDMLKDFGVRSGIDDIASFAEVFEICYRKGGNIKDVIKNTHSILSDKMRIMEDIETMITGAKNENNIMIVMPVVLIAMIKGMSPDFAKNFTTVTGVFATFLGLALFVISYMLGRKFMEIKL